LKQLDLFRKTKKIPESMAKYKRTLTLPEWKITETQCRDEKLLRVDIYCQCKRYVKVRYKFIPPTRKIGWTIPSVDDYKKEQSKFHCPHCGAKLYIMNAEIKIIGI
jgi:hypothetical protein